MPAESRFGFSHEWDIVRISVFDCAGYCNNDSIDTDQLLGEDESDRLDYSSNDSQPEMEYPIARSVFSGTTNRTISMFPTSPIRTSNFNVEFHSHHPETGEQLYRVTHHSYHDDEVFRYSPIVPPAPRPVYAVNMARTQRAASRQQQEEQNDNEDMDEEEEQEDADQASHAPQWSTQDISSLSNVFLSWQPACYEDPYYGGNDQSYYQPGNFSVEIKEVKPNEEQIAQPRQRQRRTTVLRNETTLDQQT